MGHLSLSIHSFKLSSVSLPLRRGKVEKRRRREEEAERTLSSPQATLPLLSSKEEKGKEERGKRKGKTHLADVKLQQEAKAWEMPNRDVCSSSFVCYLLPLCAGWLGVFDLRAFVSTSLVVDYSWGRLNNEWAIEFELTRREWKICRINLMPQT